MMKKKIILIQLPILTQEIQYYLDFTPFSIGSLSSYIKNLPGWELIIPPHDLLTFGSDEVLIRWIVDKSPDVLGFSSFLWNIERNIYLAKEIKKQLPHTMSIFGGPEVTPDNHFLLNSKSFDIGVVGEGEYVLTDVLNCLEKAKTPGVLYKIPNLLIKSSRDYQFTGFSYIEKPINLSPYIDGILKPSFSNSAFIETVRGCTNRCGYCFYHKNLKHLVPFSPTRFKKEINWFLKNRVKDVSFVDPSFCKNPFLKDILRGLKNLNKEKKISLFCELNAKDCTPEIAEDLKHAGFTEVEVGLQSINKKSLDVVNRSFDERRFVEGIKSLKRNDIKVRLDLIVGLPYDSLTDIQKSIDFVVERQLFDELNLYPLLILPGTSLKKLSKILSINFLKRPPYTVYSTKYMEPEDFFYAFEYAEELTGIDFFTSSPPIPPSIPSDLSQHILVENLEEAEKLINTHMELSNPVILELKDPLWIKKKEIIEKIATYLIKRNPYILINWIVSEKLMLNVDRKEILVFFPRRTLSIDLDFFSTSSFFQSVQLFIKVTHKKSCSLIRIPYNPEYTLSMNHMIKKQNSIWIFLSEDNKELEVKTIKAVDNLSFLKECSYYRILIDSSVVCWAK